MSTTEDTDMPFMRDLTSSYLIKEMIDVIEGTQYTNIAGDRGGKTKFGIIEDTAIAYKHLWSKYGFNGNMPDMPRGLAEEIYLIGFWNKVSCEQVRVHNPALAGVLFNIAVNSAPSRAGSLLQRALNVLNRDQKDYPDVTVDGNVGRRTLDALQAYRDKRGWRGMMILTNTILSLMGARYVDISEKDVTQEAFTNGWEERTFALVEKYVPLMLAVRRPFQEW